MRVVPLLTAIVTLATLTTISAVASINLPLLGAKQAWAQPVDISDVDSCKRAQNLARKDAEPGTILIYLELCKARDGSVAEQLATLRTNLETAGYVRVTVETDPPVADSVGFVDVLGDVPFPIPATVLLPPGTHRVGAIAPGHHGMGQQVTLSKNGRATTISLRLDKQKTNAGGTSAVDFSDEPDAAAPTTADDLPAAEHDELLKARYRRGLAAQGGTTVTHSKRTGVVGVVGVGGTAGMSLGTLRGGGAPAADTRLGLAAALMLVYRINGALVLLPEAGFAQRGAKGASVDYLAFPVRLGYLHRLGPFAVHGAAGPELAISISSEMPAQTMDLGFGAGFGVHIPLGRGSLVIDFYARFGFTEVVDGSNAHDRSGSLRAGYLF